MEFFHTSVLAIHIMNAGLLLGVTVLATYASSVKQMAKNLFDLIGLVGKKIPLLVGTQLLTGLYLVSSGWSEFSHNPLFWTKMIIYVVHGFIARTLMEKSMKNAEVGQDGIVVLKKDMKTMAYVSLLLFVAIVTIAVFMVEGLE